MSAPKPIIGITGGIASGKSYISNLFAQEGCLVINSDQQVADAYRLDSVRATLKQWWGADVFKPNGDIDRRAIAARVFSDPEQRRRLEGLLHPIVRQMRDGLMAQHADDPAIKAFVWDTPLLIETGLHTECDAIVFVDALFDQRLARVRATRGWDRAELERREKIQLPLDKKRQLANDIVLNTAGPDDDVRNQVREILSRILAGVRR